MSPEEFEANRPPDEWADQGEKVNGIITGPSDDSGYRCVVLLEPIQPGEEVSKASDPICTKGPIQMVDGVSLKSSFLIAKFYDKTRYANLLIEYYGTQACSPQISYGGGCRSFTAKHSVSKKLFCLNVILHNNGCCDE